jgi:hypothetical protein
MGTALRTWVTGLLLLVSSGCVVVAPGDGAQRSPGDPVTFAGYTAVRAQRVELQVLTAEGRFETFATTRASRDALLLDDGTRLYAWDLAAVVPHWQGSGCDQSATVRALGMVGRTGTPLLTFDEAGASCMSDAIQRGEAIGVALSTCSRSLQSVIEIVAGTSTVLGDVEVTTQSEADALACATTIDGNLTVRPAQQVVSLPNLQQVTGNLLIEVEDGAVGGSGVVEAEQADLPALTSVGGDVHFSHLDGGYNVGVNLGLPALTMVQGDLILGLSSFNGYNIGLSAVQAVAGNLTIVAEGDFYAPSLLVSLTSVAGDLSVSTSSAGSSGYVLNNLENVGGNVSLDALRNFAQPILNGLHTVGGDLSILGSYWIGARLNALTSVAGTLHIGGYLGGALPPGASMGGATLAMGALSLIDSHFDELPFNAATSIASSGAITIEDNALLCQASVDAFVTAQLADGWAGPLNASNNTGSCAP